MPRMRSLICISMLLAVATPVLAAVSVTREKCDELLAKLPRDPWLRTRDGSALAWGEAASGQYKAVSTKTGRQARHQQVTPAIAFPL